jgi:hypothetical protein
MQEIERDVGEGGGNTKKVRYFIKDMGGGGSAERLGGL